MAENTNNEKHFPKHWVPWVIIWAIRTAAPYCCYDLGCGRGRL